MNLFYGELIDDNEVQNRLSLLPAQTVKTRSTSKLSPDIVIDACEKLINSVEEDFLLEILEKQGMSENKASREIAQAKKIMSRENLTRRVLLELGASEELDLPGTAGSSTPIKVIRRPLGTLFHIAAGNLDVLPAFSVIEGLLSGNINILKLPGGVDELSVTVLKLLTEIEPRLIPYIYVFDFPSTELSLMRKMAEIADAIVVWGGAEAVKSVRSLAEPNTKIIEWGHKLSFAYASIAASDEELQNVAFNICDTNGTLCSSCQGIFVDTDDMAKVLNFGKRFLGILSAEVKKHDPIQNAGIRAQKSLEMYTEAIEAMTGEDKAVLRGDGCGLIVKKDSSLEPSYGFRNIWVKPLPKEKLAEELTGYKGFLQTAALLCPDEEREALTELLISAGVTRITGGIGMSEVLDIEPHDGRMPLWEYSRLVTISGM